MCRSCGSAISSAVTANGPVGVNPSKDLQRDHWASENWTLRAVMSLTTVVGIIDMAYAFMAFPTMYTLLRLAPKAKAALAKYIAENPKRK
jgi:hypothetical protein